MIRLTILSRPLPALALLAVFVSPSALHPQAREVSRPAISLSSYDVVLLELKKPFVMRDREGKPQSYDRAYVVTLKGRFPADQALGMELFIGDYRVPEYGGTRDGLYFRIYDEKLLARLEGKDFRYRFATKEIHSFNIRFSVERFQPFKLSKEQ